MAIIGRPGATSFSLAQRRTLVEWDASQLQGFAIRVTTNHEYFPELAELYTYDRMRPLWFLNATLAGTVVITRASGADQELDTIEAALGRVVELERQAPDTACLARAEQGWHRPLRSCNP